MIPVRQDVIILFTRYPEPGRCKTRLIPALGRNGATRLHQEMTYQVLAQLARLTTAHPHLLEIHHDGGSQARMRSWLGAGHHYHRQADGDIGCRMQAAIIRHLGRAQRLLLIGSDCPDLSAAIMAEAFAALTTHDLVLGPAYDGGYYLIGVGAEISALICHDLFQDIPWSTAAVYTTTKKRAEQHRLRCHTLARLHDIDTPADLRHLHYHPHPE
ncbi:MAG: TIGR04282 family arsenosugar biosynthesis glycosyltransferase [Desulfoarculaceae bacterium]|nr:TIGR04282 family arsenosugar biosynthesis glycosyltransferase [Desulfoarculaceae bacterium]